MSSHRDKYIRGFSMSIYEYYKRCILENLSLSQEDMFFKSDPRYNYVLEHVDFAQGYQYLLLVEEEFSELFHENKDMMIDLCRQNDIIGKPKKHDFKGFCECSPTNLRYLYQSMLALDFIKDINIQQLNVVEIGGGYGGLCLFMHKLSHLFNLNINSYIIYDLAEAQDLQYRYLYTHGINVDSVQNKKDCFLISNYAFSELPDSVRSNYEKYIIQPYCSNGFLAWNGCDLYEFVKGKEIKYVAERPSTHPNNKYVYFKEN